MHLVFPHMCVNREDFWNLSIFDSFGPTHEAQPDTAMFL